MPTDQEVIYAFMERDPMYFRQHLMMNAAENQVRQFNDIMEGWQRADFEAMDPALRYLAGIPGVPKPAKKRFYRQRARGHSKTSDQATSLTWLLWAAQKRVTGIIGAEDKSQAGLVRAQMEAIGRNNPWLTKRLEYHKNVVRNCFTGSEIAILSRDVASSWGETPDLVMCDELTHWTQPDFWHSLFSSFAKKEGILIIACNAGMGRGWQWNVREMARTSSLWHFSALEGTPASWITEEVLTEQRAGLPPTQFARLWLNKWQETGGEFVSLDEAEACGSKLPGNKLTIRDRCQVDGWKYIATIDYAEKRDRTVGTVMHQEGPKVIIDRMDVIDPIATGMTTRVAWCKTWMKNVQRDFGGESGTVFFVVDKYQLLGVAQELMDEGFNIEFFDFASGVGNWELSVILRQFIVHEKVVWYPGCGSIPSPWGRDDLETELASLIVTQYQNGRRWRFDHIQDDTHHDDRAYGLGSGLWFVVKNSGGYGEWGIVPPDRLGGFDLQAVAAA